jgi:hypothetical protein
MRCVLGDHYADDHHLKLEGRPLAVESAQVVVELEVHPAEDEDM